jgi:hypothetical protein
MFRNPHQISVPAFLFLSLVNYLQLTFMAIFWNNSGPQVRFSEQLLESQSIRNFILISSSKIQLKIVKNIGAHSKSIVLRFRTFDKYSSRDTILLIHNEKTANAT